MEKAAIKEPTVENCELSEILIGLQNESNTLGSEAIAFLNKLAYFDLSNGINDELCQLIVSRWSIHTDPRMALTQEKEAKNVLQMLRDKDILCEMKKSKSNTVFLQMCPNLQEKILSQNQHDFSDIIDLCNTLKSIWMNWPFSIAYRPHMVHIHKRLKDLNWPGNTIELSACITSQLFFYNDDDSVILNDIVDYFNASKGTSRAIDWTFIQMIKIHKETLSKSRKVLQPSDIVTITDVNGESEHIRLDHYGAWMLNKIRTYSSSGLDCDTIASVAANSLERLQKHARFCSTPDDLTLDWIIDYRGIEWHSFNCFAALACYQIDECVRKLCAAYIRKLRELAADECSEKSEYSLKDVYTSWVCLRDLVKASRVQGELIAALCNDDGLQLLTMNFVKCTTALESKEYLIKYQAQTVIEMLKPLLVNGRPEVVAKLLKMQEFWNFAILVLFKHPFINERYNLQLENDLLCACEVYLDLLIAVCNRKDDAIADGFLISYFMGDYLQAFTSVIAGASEINEPRRRDTCMFYFFTILFTLFTQLKSNEVIEAYLNNEDVRKEIVEYAASDQTNFEVANGCLQEYQMPTKSFSDVYSQDKKNTIVDCLIRKMLRVPEMVH